jgi:hypothetical protein
VNWAVAAKAAFGLSLAVLVFGSGLGARFADVTALLRRPGLLARSLKLRLHLSRWRYPRCLRCCPTGAKRPGGEPNTVWAWCSFWPYWVCR